jgi:hypothetical protein
MYYRMKPEFVESKEVSESFRKSGVSITVWPQWEYPYDEPLEYTTRNEWPR